MLAQPDALAYPAKEACPPKAVDRHRQDKGAGWRRAYSSRQEA